MATYYVVLAEVTLKNAYAECDVTNAYVTTDPTLVPGKHIEQRVADMGNKVISGSINTMLRMGKKYLPISGLAAY